MDDMLIEMITAIVVAVLGYFLGIFRDRGYNTKVEDLYQKYELAFKVSGALVKEMDEKLYVEMEEAITKMKTAYESPAFTVQAFNEIVKECKDVFDRVQELTKNRK